MSDINLANKGALVVRAYCTKCGKLLMESVRMSKKQLISMWDRTVLGAVHIKCEDCELKFPNFNIELRIYNAKIHEEFPIEKYIRLPKGKRGEVQALFKSLERSVDESVSPEDGANRIAELNAVRDKITNKRLEDNFAKELERRLNHNGKVTTD